jgi:hypothetical protein
VKTPGITKWLESLGRWKKSGEQNTFGKEGMLLDKKTHPSTLWSWSLALGAGWSFQSEREERDYQQGISTLTHIFPGQKPQSSLDTTSSISPGILGLLAPSSIKRDNFISADASFTHRTFLPVWSCLQPLGGRGREKNEVVSSTRRIF